MIDLNFHPIEVEGNIYAMATLEGCDTNLLLVALRDCQVCCIEYKDNKPHLRKIQFAYLPSAGRILGIRILKRKSSDFIIAIAHCQCSDLSKPLQTKSRLNQTRSSLNWDSSREQTQTAYEYYLNLYSSAKGITSDNKGFEIESVASCCQTIHLRYSPAYVLPFQIMTSNTRTGLPEVKSYGFMIPGGDHQVHAFLDRSMDDPQETPAYYDLEENTAEAAGLEELPKTLDSKPIWAELIYVYNSSREGNNLERWTCFGMENGSFVLFHGIYNKSRGRYELLSSFTKHFIDTIVPCVRFFTIKSTYPSPLREFLNLSTSDNRMKDYNQYKGLPSIVYSEHDVVNLFVVNGTGHCAIYEDLVNNGIDREHQLPDSQRKDVNVTATIADINMDGKNEIIIGGYGDELLTYQFDDETNCYYLDGLKLLNEPVYSIIDIDLTNNAIKNLLLLLANGILVIQPHVIRALNIAERRFELVQRYFLQNKIENQ